MTGRTLCELSASGLRGVYVGRIESEGGGIDIEGDGIEGIAFEGGGIEGIAFEGGGIEGTIDFEGGGIEGIIDFEGGGIDGIIDFEGDGINFLGPRIRLSESSMPAGY